MSDEPLRRSVGPFRIKKGKYDDFFRDALIDAEDEDLLIKTKDGYGNRVNLHEGDWHLFAAAPDMLQVLQELDECAYYWSQYDVPVGIHDRIKSAIAKAKGQQP